MSLEAAVQENTAAIQALTRALAGMKFGDYANSPATPAEIKASTPAPAAPPAPRTPPPPPPADDDVKYDDVAAEVNAFIKAGASNKAKGRDAALALLATFKDAKGAPLAKQDDTGTWSGNAKAARPSDYAGIIAAFKAVK